MNPTPPPRIPDPPEDRKSAILGAALAVFAEKGIEATTIEDIRKACGASVGSIYHHFGTREGIAAALFAQGLDEYWGRLLERATSAADARSMIHALIEAHAAWITAKPDMARFLFSRGQAVGRAHESAVRQQTASHFKALFALFKPWFDAGVLRRLPIELYAPLLMGPSQELARQWLAGRIELSPSDAVAKLAGAAWRSLAADAPRNRAASQRRRQ